MPKFAINNYPWDCKYQPKAEGYVARTPDALRVTLTAWEQTIRAFEMETGGAVFKDSCLEFFFQPAPETDARYINIEINPIGTMHIGIGEGRHGRTVLGELPDGIAPITRIERGKLWSVSYELPFSWIQSLFPDFSHEGEIKLRGNFYACDESIHPHFGTAFPVEAAQPDFHCPACFQEIIIE